MILLSEYLDDHVGEDSAVRAIDDFVVKADICPAGEKPVYQFTGQQDGKAIRTYCSSHCEVRVLKDKCTKGKTTAFADGTTKVFYNVFSNVRARALPNLLCAA